MNRFVLPLFSIFLLLWLPGCSAMHSFVALIDPPPVPSSSMRQSALDRLAPVVRTDFERLAGSHHRDLLTVHESVENTPAQFKRRLAVNALTQPWDGLTEIERQGLLLAEIAKGGSVNLPALLDVLETGMDRTSTFYAPVPLPASSAQEDLLAFMIGSLEQASLYREKALTNLTEAEKRFLFLHARSMAEHFIPQISSLSNQAREQVKADLRFAELLEGKVDYASLIATAQTLARLANERWLHQAAAAWTKPLPASAVPPGVTGDVLMVRETSYGLIIIGGPGPNTYEIDKGIGLIIDMGGNDLYRGMIAASASEDQGNAVVIDLKGDDTYTGAPFGLATGRLGVGLLIDHDGDDVYQLDIGSGGAGFGGLGILLDSKGNDIYMGNRLTQGAAIGGLGLLLDGAGNDRYTSHGFALGFGGPLGVGAIIDIAGQRLLSMWRLLSQCLQCAGRPHREARRSPLSVRLLRAGCRIGTADFDKERGVASVQPGRWLGNLAGYRRARSLRQRQLLTGAGLLFWRWDEIGLRWRRRAPSRSLRPWRIRTLRSRTLYRLSWTRPIWLLRPLLQWGSRLGQQREPHDRCRKRPGHLCLRANDRSWSSRLCRLGAFHRRGRRGSVPGQVRLWRLFGEERSRVLRSRRQRYPYATT